MERLWMEESHHIDELAKRDLCSRIGVSGDRLFVLTHTDRIRLVVVSLTDGSYDRQVLKDPGRSIDFVQSFSDGELLLVSAYSTQGEPNAFIYNSYGELRDSYQVGNAVDSVQVEGDKIWIRYLEEGIASDDWLSQQGCVCLERNGSFLFSYQEAADKQGLPQMENGYALHVAPEGEVWLYYFPDHFLVRMMEGRIKQFWKGGPILHWRSPFVRAGSFARWEKQLLFVTPNRVLFRGSLQQGELDKVIPVDKQGEPIAFDRWWMRDSRLFLAKEGQIYIYNMKNDLPSKVDRIRLKWW